MDMIEFSQIINHDNLKRNMSQYFDEHVAMYNVICNYDIGIDINAKGNDTSIVYTVLPKSSCDVNKLLEVLSAAVISIYQKCYVIHIAKIGNTLDINLVKTSS